ncbi:MAG: hypothetical protein WKF60_02535 [Ilumatobacter sp.]
MGLIPPLRSQPATPATVALVRFVRSKRLADAIDQAAFCSISSSPGARAFLTGWTGLGMSTVAGVGGAVLLLAVCWRPQHPAKT